MVKEVSNKVLFGEFKIVTSYKEDYEHGKKL